MEAISPKQKRSSAILRDSTKLSSTKARATPEARGQKGRSYRRLPTEFRHHGFTYRRIARKQDAAIYEQKWTGCINPSVAYEVIRIRRRDGFYIGERFVEPAEVYPKCKAWGGDGFTMTERDAAFAKLREIGR